MISAMASSFVIGVAGGSGRKNHGCEADRRQSRSEHVTLLQHDRYYRDRNDLRLEERAVLNYDHPNSLETDLLVRHVRN
jgi:uridine kinase